MYNLKIAIRTLFINKRYTIANIVGLSISLTVSLFIFLWVDIRLNRDSNFERYDDTYLVAARFDNTGEYWTHTPAPFAREVLSKIPEVYAACSFNPYYDLGFIEYNNEKFFGDTYYSVDTTFFKVFDKNFTEGSINHPFTDQHSVVITEKLAKKIFGTESALGKQIKGSNGGDSFKYYTVSGVIEDYPADSRFKGDALFSLESSNLKDNWNTWSYQNYLVLNKDADIKNISQKIDDIYKSVIDESDVSEFILQSFGDMGLYHVNGTPEAILLIRIMIAIGIAILTISSINYINIVTARSNKRVQEISIRKIIGGKRLRIFNLIMSETLITVFISLILAIILLIILMPVLNPIVEGAITLNLTNPDIWLISIGTLLFTALVSGIYPAIKISSIAPVDSVGGGNYQRIKHSSLMRRILVTIQFVATTILIFLTITLTKQFNYISNRDLGYDKTNVLAIEIFTNKAMRDNYQTFKQELEREKSIISITASEQNILNVGNSTTNVIWQGKPENVELEFAAMGVDKNLFESMNMTILQGNNFTEADQPFKKYYINETAVKLMGIGDPVGKTISLWGREGIIGGVIKDFNFRSVRAPIEPIIMYFPYRFWTIYLKHTPESKAEALNVVSKAWDNLNPDFPFTYEFLDDTYNYMNRENKSLSQLFNIFGIVSIVISILGLYSLVTFSYESRLREIRIRRVLGASANNLIVLISKEFIILLALSLIIALPLAYLLASRILSQYAFHINISIGIYLLTILIVMLSAIVMLPQIMKVKKLS